MKHLSIFVAILLLVFILTACGSTAQPTSLPGIVEPTPELDPTPVSAANNTPVRVSIDYNYEGALATRLLLAFGSLKLVDTTTPISVEQAPQMLMLWQALE